MNSSNVSNTRAIGVDLGGVVSDLDYRSDDFWSKLDQTPEVNHAFESLRTLGTLFHGHIYIVSQVDQLIMPKTESWFKAHKFFERTGIEPENVIFCAKNEDKAGICEHLGISDFIDDRVSILDSLVSVKYRYLFKTSHEAANDLSPIIVAVNNWDELLQKIQGTLPA